MKLKLEQGSCEDHTTRAATAQEQHRQSATILPTAPTAHTAPVHHQSSTYSQSLQSIPTVPTVPAAPTVSPCSAYSAYSRPLSYLQRPPRLHLIGTLVQVLEQAQDGVPVPAHHALLDAHTQEADAHARQGLQRVDALAHVAETLRGQERRGQDRRERERKRATKESGNFNL